MSPAERRALCLGLGGAARDLPPRSPRADFERVATGLDEPVGGERRFTVLTHVSDLGHAANSVVVPVHVHGRRWGAAVLNWDEVGDWSPTTGRSLQGTGAGTAHTSTAAATLE